MNYDIDPYGEEIWFVDLDDQKTLFERCKFLLEKFLEERYKFENTKEKMDDCCKDDCLFFIFERCFNYQNKIEKKLSDVIILNIIKLSLYTKIQVRKENYYYHNI